MLVCACGPGLDGLYLRRALHPRRILAQSLRPGSPEPWLRESPGRLRLVALRLDPDVDDGGDPLLIRSKVQPQSADPEFAIGALAGTHDHAFDVPRIEIQG